MTLQSMSAEALLDWHVDPDTALVRHLRRVAAEAKAVVDAQRRAQRLQRLELSEQRRAQRLQHLERSDQLGRSSSTNVTRTTNLQVASSAPRPRHATRAEGLQRIAYLRSLVLKIARKRKGESMEDVYDLLRATAREIERLAATKRGRA